MFDSSHFLSLLPKGRAGFLPAAVGLAVSLFSGVALLCESNVAGADAPLPTWCAWMPCAGACADAVGANSPDTVVSAVSPGSLPLERLLRSPASARRWVQMGQVLLSENQAVEARYCFERAVELAPHSPPVLLEAAAFYHATGRPAEGFDRMKRVLSATRDYDSVVFALYDRLTDVPVVLAQGLPLDANASRAYFLHLLNGGDLSAAHLAWDRLSARGFLDEASRRRYLRRLLDDELYDEAAAVFTCLLPASERPTGGNRITHGGFEAGSAGLSLDWVMTANPHAEARRDDSFVCEGAWSLRIEFDGEENLEYRHVAQQAVVSPGRWRLSARIRTESITSDQGIGLRVFDAKSASRWQAWTNSVVGDTPWTLVEKTVTVPPETRLVQIEVVRRPSRKLDNKLGGVAWIDDVSLRPL